MNYLLDAAASSSGMESLMQFGPMVLIIIVFYFFMIRPQMKKQKEIKAFRDSLAKGDKVVTTGGIYGVITGIKENIITLKVANDVEIRVDKVAVVRDMTDAAPQK